MISSHFCQGRLKKNPHHCLLIQLYIDELLFHIINDTLNLHCCAGCCCLSRASFTHALLPWNYSSPRGAVFVNANAKISWPRLYPASFPVQSHCGNRRGCFSGNSQSWWHCVTPIVAASHSCRLACILLFTLYDNTDKSKYMQYWLKKKKKQS